MMRATMALWTVWFLYWWIASWGVEKPAKKESSASRALHMGALSFAFVTLFSDFLRVGLLGRRLLPQSLALQCVGVGLTAAGLLFATWARVHLGRWWSGEVQIKEGHRLIQSGPYAFVRNPIYTGFLLAIIGSAVTLGEVRGLVIIAAVACAFARKIRTEESFLSAQFGSEFAAYSARTKALIPFVF